MTPEEQLARVRAYYERSEQRRQEPVWPHIAAILLVLVSFAAGLLFGWLLGSGA